MSSTRLTGAGKQPTVVIAVLAGVVLLAAACLKGIGLFRHPVAPELAALALIAAEWLLGWWLLSGRAPRVAGTLAAITFVGLAGVNAVWVAQGRKTCGCLGILEVPPMVMLAVDAILAAALLIQRPWQGNLIVVPQKPLWRTVVPAIGILVGLAGLIGIAIAPRGSLLDPITAGQRFAIEPEKWVGQPLPLLGHIETTADIARGDWTLVLYRHDCDHCMDTLRTLAAKTPSAAKSQPGVSSTERLIAVEVPPYATTKPLSAFDASAFVPARLVAGPDWLVTTPMTIRVRDGRVVAPVDNTTRVAGANSSGSSTTKPASQAPSASQPSSKPGSGSKAAAAPPPKPPPETPVLVDLGYVGRGTTTSARAKISVPGKGSVKITDIKSECDCIKVAGVKELPPGASEIAFTFAAPKDAQEYTKRFFVQTDHPELGRIIVTVRASIEMPLRITPAPLNLGTIATSKAVAGTITVTNLGPEPLRLLYATADHEGLSAEIPADAIKPGSSVKIPVSMNVSNARKGQGKAQVNIHTTCANQRVLLAFVTWHSSE